MEDMLIVHNLSKSFGTRHVLHDVSFSVPAGQICGLLGPNGAGKSTTLRILSGMLEPDKGTATLCGHDAGTIAAKRCMSFLPDDGSLFGLLSPREHFHLIADLYELDLSFVRDRMRYLVAAFDLASLLDQRIDTLSKGQRQRVAIALALTHDARILLLDEPLNGLDVNTVRAMRLLLTKMASDGCAIVYCSHILDVVQRLCERTLIICKGRLVADAKTSDLVARSTDHSLESVFHELTSHDGMQPDTTNAQ